MSESLPEEIYLASPNKKFLLLLGSLFLASLLLLFPWKYLWQWRSFQLSELLQCPAQSTDLNWQWFPFGPSIKQITLPPSCTQMPRDVTIENLSIYPGGLSFAPLGPVLMVSFNLQQMPLTLQITAGLSEQVVSFINPKVKLADLKQAIFPLLNLPGLDPQLAGHLAIDVRATIQHQQLSKYTANLSSNDFLLPAQSIYILQIPELHLKHLNLQLQGSAQQLVIDDLKLGDERAKLMLKMKGRVDLAQPFTSSQLNLKTELQLDSSLQEQFSLFLSGLQPFKKGSKQYLFQLNGSFDYPQFLE